MPELSAKKTNQKTSVKKARGSRRSKSGMEDARGRQAILKAALAEFSERGYDGTSIRNIAKRAQVDFTLITYHFGTKENLWREVAIDGAQRFKNAIDTRLAAADALSAGQKIRYRLMAEYDFACSHDSMFQFVMNELRMKGPRLEWLYEHFLSVNIEDLFSCIQKAQADGEIVPGDPVMIYKLMQIGVRSLLMSEEEYVMLTGEQPRSAEKLEEFWSMFDTVFFAKVAHANS